MLREGCKRVAKSGSTGQSAQERSELCPMSFVLLTVVLAMAMVALVLLLYYLLRRWL
jgi:multisubunit Na+/H+ antiporter MnhC subunit